MSAGWVGYVVWHPWSSSRYPKPETRNPILPLCPPWLIRGKRPKMEPCIAAAPRFRSPGTSQRDGARQEGAQRHIGLVHHITVGVETQPIADGGAGIRWCIERDADGCSIALIGG